MVQSPGESLIMIILCKLQSSITESFAADKGQLHPHCHFKSISQQSRLHQTISDLKAWVLRENFDVRIWIQSKKLILFLDSKNNWLFPVHTGKAYHESSVSKSRAGKNELRTFSDIGQFVSNQVANYIQLIYLQSLNTMKLKNQVDQMRQNNSRKM